MNKNIQTFIGCDAEYTDSDLVLFGAPFDGTTSYRPGTRFASNAIRNESYSIETYSPYIDRDLCDTAVFDVGDLELPFGNTEKALSMITQMTSQIVTDNKIPFMIGGEHLVTLGAVRAVAEQYPDLHIVHFDAHTDLRESFLGETLSHASVIKRCHDIVGDHRIFQFGIRSGEKAEFEWAKEHISIQKFNFDGIETLAERIGNHPVYFTIDLDVVDPSEFPGTGTPEAGGVGFLQLIHAIQTVSKLRIVGVDINELSPPYDPSGISTALACKVVRELILNIL